MALRLVKSVKLCAAFLPKPTLRCLSLTPAKCTSEDVKINEIKKSVFISQSTDVFTNLALEDWMYKNLDFAKHHVLLLWQNDPCVVVGRHQNPWMETDVTALEEYGFNLARRNSGGGAVYHDRGNLNLSFFAPRDRLSRKYNLEIIARALFREYGIRAEITQRQDITVREGHKISGTAAKLGKTNAYHHCTLLVRVNKVDLRQALQKPESKIETKATQSIPSPVLNLCEENPKVNVECLIGAIGWEFLRTKPMELKDGGAELISQQKGFQMVNPTEHWFPGITELKNDLTSWEWRFGKTPKFRVTRSFSVPNDLLNTGLYSSTQELKVSVRVENGLIQDVTVSAPPGLCTDGIPAEVTVFTDLVGRRFTDETLRQVHMTLSGTNVDRTADKFVAECIRHVL